MSNHPAPIPTVEELTPEQRLQRLETKLRQFADEFDGWPIAIPAARAVEAIQQSLRRQAHVPVKR